MTQILEPGILGQMLGQSGVGDRQDETYIERVLATQFANLIAYWPLNETSGTSADNAEGTAARDGTYARNVTTMGTSTGIGDGNTAPVFDGTNDVCDIYSASFNTALNTSTGTAAIWMQAEVAEWGDATLRRPLYMAVDGDNRIYIQRSSANELVVVYEAGNTIISHTVTGFTTANWYHVGLTWDTGEDEVIVYQNGSQFSSILTGLGTWVGDLNSSNTTIGATSNGPANAWNGRLAHCATWSTALTAGDILSLATVPN